MVLSGVGWEHAPFSDKGVEIWSLNDTYLKGLPRVDRWFEQHKPADWYLYGETPVSCEIPHGMYPRPMDHKARLNTLNVPVYMQNVEPDIPRSVRYPLEDVEAVSGCAPLFDSSIAYMVGLALLEKAEWIGIYGANMAGPTEYARQRPNVQWLLGLAVGRGAKLSIGQPSTLLAPSHYYGYEPGPVVETDSLRNELVRVLNARESLVTEWLARDPMPGEREQVMRLDRQIVECHEEMARVGLTAAGVNTTQLALIGA